MAAPYLTSRQLADRWGMQPQTLANWRVAGKGPPFIKPGEGKGARVLYALADIETWENARRYTNSQQPGHEQPPNRRATAMGRPTSD